MKFLRWLLAAPFLLIIFVFCGMEINKVYWDHRVSSLCRKEGGLNIFEVVNTKKGEYPGLFIDARNVPFIPGEWDKTRKDPFFIRENTEFIKSFILQVRKSKTLLVRRSDGKILSEMITFGRGGGDFPNGISGQSSFSCFDIPDFKFDIVNSTIRINNN